jgi:drug/metabolite transporter (DMT)-like permease
VQVLAVAGIVLCTVIWGSCFVTMKAVVAYLKPCSLLAARYALAAIAMALCCRATGHWPAARDVAPGLLLGALLAASYLLQTFGLVHTTASNNAFLTAFYVILVPIVNRLLFQGPIRAANVVAAAVALAGIALISLNESFRIGSGDALTLACSLAFAFHMVYLQRFAPGRDPLALTFVMVAGTAAACLVAALAVEGGRPFLGDPPMPSADALGAAGGLAAAVAGAFGRGSVTLGAVAFALLYLSVVGTMGSMTLQTFGQKHVPAAPAAVLFSMESVYGAAFSIALLGDPLTPRILAGFALMFGAALLAILKGA